MSKNHKEAVGKWLCLCNLRETDPFSLKFHKYHIQDLSVHSSKGERGRLSADQTVAQGGLRAERSQSCGAGGGRFGFTPGCADWRSASHTSLASNISPCGMNLQTCPEDFTTKLLMMENKRSTDPS